MRGNQETDNIRIVLRPRRSFQAPLPELPDGSEEWYEKHPGAKAIIQEEIEVVKSLLQGKVSLA